MRFTKRNEIWSHNGRDYMYGAAQEVVGTLAEATAAASAVIGEHPELTVEWDPFVTITYGPGERECHLKDASGWVVYELAIKQVEDDYQPTPPRDPDEYLPKITEWLANAIRRQEAGNDVKLDILCDAWADVILRWANRDA